MSMIRKTVLSPLAKIRIAMERGLNAGAWDRSPENLNAVRPNRQMWDEYNYGKEAIKALPGYNRKSPREKLYTSNEDAIKDYLGEYYDVPEETLKGIRSAEDLDRWSRANWGEPYPYQDLEVWSPKEFIKYYRK